MTSISDTVNRHVNFMVDKLMRETTDKIRSQLVAENALDYVVTQVFSAEAIGRAANKLDGDRALALQVISAAFGAMNSKGSEESKPDDLSCGKCTAPIEFTISGFTHFPDRVVCPNCGAMGAT